MEAYELTERYIEFEESNNMFDLWIGDCQIWAYIRFQVNTVLQQHLGIWRGADDSYKSKRKVKKNYKNILGEKFIHNQFLAGHRDVLIVSLSRKVMENGSYKCVYTDLLDKALKFPHYVLDKRNDADQFLPQKSKNILYMDERPFFNNQKENIGRLNKKWFDKKIIRRIENFFDIELKYEEKKKIFHYVTYVLDVRKKWMHYYAYMLKKIRPKVIIVVCYYYWDIIALCELAKKMKIPVIELQHGIIGREHIAYNFPTHIKTKCIPDYLFAYGEFDKSSMRFPISRNHIIPVGFPELEQQCYSKKESLRKAKKTILFISSAVPDIVVYANKLAEKLDPKNYHVILKLHPAECNGWKRNYGKYITCKELDIVAQEEINVYTYLQNADWVIGTMSTVLLEATLFDVKIAVIDTNNSSATKILYENKKAILVKSEEMLIEAIEEDNFAPSGEMSIFEKDSLNKMLDGIAYVINREKMKI